MQKLFIFIIGLFLVGCSTKQPIATSSATIIFKTPLMKFYDKGFITKYDNYINLQIFSIGSVILDLKIYQDEICRSRFECLDNKEFNSKYLDKSYSENFMFELFKKDKISFKDKKHNIIIKVRKD